MVVVIVLLDSAGRHWALALQFQSVPRDRPQGLGSNHGIMRAFPSQGEELQQVCLAETWSPETNGWWPPNRWLDLRFDAWLELQKPVWRHSRPSAGCVLEPFGLALLQFAATNDPGASIVLVRWLTCSFDAG